MFYKIDTEKKIIYGKMIFKGSDQVFSGMDYIITFQNKNIIFGEYSYNYNIDIPQPGKLDGQIDRFFIVVNLKHSIVKIIGVSTNQFYSDPDTTHLSGGETKCSILF